MNRAITRRLFYYVDIELLSPMSLGNGDATMTDNDLLLDDKGQPFIPGTSIAGVFQSYQNISFNTEEDKQSPVYVSDATLNTKDGYKKDIRDGIKLDDEKITVDGAKYDFEVVNTGTKFSFRLEIIEREGEDHSFIDDVDQALEALACGEIRFGAKTSRGYGRAKILDVYRKVFTKENLKEYLEFDVMNKEMYDIYEDYKKKISLENSIMRVSLQQLGGISIRKYKTTPGEEDFEHIKMNGQSVIPGTSWNGMLRKQFAYYHKMLGHKESDLDQWFGYVDSKGAQKSKIIIDESQIDGGEDLTLTRNKIDRFTGGTVDKALFKESVHYNGTTQLEIRVPKDNKYIIGIFLLILKDIDNGFIALGGQTSIGRGLFEVKDIFIDEKPYKEDNYEEYRTCLINYSGEDKNNGK